MDAVILGAPAHVHILSREDTALVMCLCKKIFLYQF